MQVTRDMLVADIATNDPGTIRIFQAHGLDFCCGGQIPLGDACSRRDIDTDSMLAELRAASKGRDDLADWQRASMTELVAYIQQRFHAPLREELPRLHQMVNKVVDRHGDRLPHTLLPLKATFEGLQQELLHHMRKEDVVLFPAVVALEASGGAGPAGSQWMWIQQPIGVMEAEHEQAGAALARLREITHGYAPPEDACPTFRGLYYGLAQLEHEMHLHVHLENNILFPRVERLARGVTARTAS
jgi:regulator of cell morphogenesis and NO signaling